MMSIASRLISLEYLATSRFRDEEWGSTSPLRVFVKVSLGEPLENKWRIFDVWVPRASPLLAERYEVKQVRSGRG